MIGFIFKACLFENVFTNKMDRFTDYEGDSKIMFESIFIKGTYFYNIERGRAVVQSVAKKSHVQ